MCVLTKQSQCLWCSISSSLVCVECDFMSMSCDGELDSLFSVSDHVLAQSGSTSQLVGLLDDSSEAEEALMKSEASYNSSQPAGLELIKWRSIYAWYRIHDPKARVCTHARSYFAFCECLQSCMVPVSATFYKQLYLLPNLQLPCIYAVLILM